ncbi:DUF411 domain-containing protein [Limobrevibacterium gyesilva]|uniref:DUF411 domain-containing protein n=1 Tax=Limobrevibacterium gyesilva TaxID=2991712 RepID=A0AA41YP73_9PROT|nr:DUF411 domain-containing protein [Limobrevibacterium gyesilva]MCW3477539.1 DUF411 domain-containing protein [Limobrevibacterium gyesilva]
MNQRFEHERKQTMKPISRRAALLMAACAPLPALSAAPTQVTLYKNPQCGCCEGYAAYLRQNGFAVDVKPTNDLDTMSREAGVPDELEGCHLSMIDGYVVEGHVPIEAIRKLLAERPPLKAITLPGMPEGSPGMTGTKQGPFTVYAIAKDGAASVYMNI